MPPRSAFLETQSRVKANKADGDLQGAVFRSSGKREPNLEARQIPTVRLLQGGRRDGQASAATPCSQQQKESLQSLPNLCRVGELTPQKFGGSKLHEVNDTHTHRYGEEILTVFSVKL